jgi:7-cyano-7-deazaguanine synthase
MNDDNPPNAVVLLSGGMDSTTALAEAASAGFRCHALTIDYGQRHVRELEAAERVARSFGIADHKTIRLDLRLFGGSALTSDDAVPKDRTDDEIGRGIPVTYVPARNTIFLSLALAWAETLGAFDIYLGVNCLDYSGYPDCRPEFLDAFARMADLATAAGVEHRGKFRIHAPLLQMTKADIVRRGIALGVDFGLTHTCYDPVATGESCGHCDACLLRLAAFREVGMADPIAYAESARNS